MRLGPHRSEAAGAQASVRCFVPTAHADAPAHQSLDAREDFRMTDDFDHTDNSVQSTAWPAALALAVVAGSLATSCLMPFVALAVAAAATMPWRRAMATLAAGWLTNQ